MTNEPADQLIHLSLAPPESFVEQVMQQVRAEPMPIIHRTRRRSVRLQQGLRWLALSGGALLGATQLIGFVFGIWAAVAAG